MNIDKLNTCNIIEKWYKKLEFDSRFDDEFYKALSEISVPEDTNAYDYDINCQDGKRNFLSYLYMCEELSEQYKKNGISEKILLDTLSDIKRWCDTWSDLKGELYLGELKWLSIILQFKLFRIGRLQFQISTPDEDYPDFCIKKDDTLIRIHIPPGSPLDEEICKDSIKQAKVFFAKFFPDVQYKYFGCNSWLLDDTLKEILPANSNIIKFGNMFNKVKTEESYALLGFIFKWGITENEIKDMPCKTSLAKKVKQCVLDGKKFHKTFGIIQKN